MFAKTIIDSDAFLDMPATSQLLYFHLSLRADDDGFINKPKTILRMVGCKDDDMNLLIMKKFIIPFESGVVVIKHWKIHNYIQNDRYSETKYKNEKAQLVLDENKAYRLQNHECIQDVSIMETQVRLGKDRLGKDRKDIGVFESYANGNMDLLSALNEFDRMRKSMKKAMTDRAKEMLCTDLDKLAAEGQNIIACINESIFHNWQGVFPVKEKEVMKNGTDTKPDAGNDKWGITTNRL